MFQSPGVQNLLSQVSSNPQLLENMMQSPYMQDMMNQMVRNPELMNSVRFKLNFVSFSGTVYERSNDYDFDVVNLGFILLIPFVKFLRSLSLGSSKPSNVCQ